MRRPGGYSACAIGLQVLGTLALGAVLTGPGATAARAAEAEGRDFAVYIDGKRAGDFTLSVVPQADGTTTVSARARVRISYLVYRYVYTLDDTEIWKNGTLQRLQSTCNDDGKRYTVSAYPEGVNLKVNVNGRAYVTRPDLWTSTYWHLPDARFRNQAVPLLDSDTGRAVLGSLHFLGMTPVSVAGQLKNCAHYQVRGLVPADLWFDEQERLVRQEGVEDGHRTLLELVRIRP